MFTISLILLYLTVYIYSAMISPDFLNTSVISLKDALIKPKDLPQVENDFNEIDVSSVDVCATEVCLKESAKMLLTMDESVNPCDDFYEFACGNLLRDTELPADKQSQTAFTIVQDKVTKQVRSILTEEPQPSEANPIKLAKMFTKTCMDEATLNEKGIAPMIEVLNRYGGWPVVEGDEWQSENWNWLEASRNISSDGLVELILDCHIEVEPKNSSKHILTINRAEFGLPRRGLVKGIENPSVRDYYSFMVDAAVMFGANKTYAQMELYVALEFEIALAKIALTEEDLADISIINNPYSIEKLQKLYPYINWLEYFNGCTRNMVKVDENEVVIVVDPDYLQLLNAILEMTPNRVIANYFGWKLVFFGSSLLNDELYRRNREYFDLDANISDIRLTECVKKTMQYLEISVGATYIRKYFDENSKSEALNITKSIHEEFINNLKGVSWMDEESRTAAIAKAVAMHFNIAYPDELIDDQKLEKYFHGLELSSDSFIHSVMNIRKFTSERTMSKLRVPINKTDWETHSIPTKVGGYYSISENSIQLPAATLQDPFFSHDRPSYLNFGGIGWFVAHEITHGFDATGRLYDPNGNLIDWWNEKTVAKFESNTKCFIDQYSSYEEPTFRVKVNGIRTLDENIADNGGIKGLYAAYQTYVRRNGPDLLLPDLNYTQNQLFWISAAQTWCSVGRPIFDIIFYQIDVHAPNRYRVIGSFSNMQNFSNDFNCPVGSPMNPIDKCQMW